MLESRNTDNLYKEHTIIINSDSKVLNRDNPYLEIYFFIKRILDILISISGIILLLPILIFIMILIKIDSTGPIFYLQERVGLKAKHFKIIKFRSMTVDAEIDGAQWAQQNDPRVTKIGGFIRKTRIDEIPQLVNVIKGDMSLIGPRPERPVFTKQFNKEIPGFVNRLLVKPGVTGWAQVNGGYEITPREKLELDMYYINKMSIWIDIHVLLKTIKVVITGEGAR